MSWAAVAVGTISAVGAYAGSQKSGEVGAPSWLQIEAEKQGRETLGQYGSLVNQGPGTQDYLAGVNAQRGLAGIYQNAASGGMYDFTAGNQLAAQSFAGQREALNQNFTSQMQQASRAAALSGRSTNDPILRARLAQQQTQQLSQLQANQSSSAVNFARQSMVDQLSNQTNAANTLYSLGNTALTNRQNLFGMTQSALGGERQNQLAQAQNERAAGGGFAGGLTGALGGAAAGFNAAQGFGAMGSGPSVGQPSAGGMDFGQAGLSSAQNFFGGSNPYAQSGLAAPQAGRIAPASAAPQVAAPYAGQSFNPSNFANFQQRGMAGGF